MRKKRKIISLFTLLALFICMLPNIAVKAVSDVNIVSSTNTTVEQAKKWAKSKGATDTFISLADLYWKYSPKHGNINPALAYVQAAKETGYGKFGGVIDEGFHNPAGMKITAGGDDYDKDAHQRFSTWDEGVQAQLDHLALYAGAAGYPRSSTPDPRHFSYIAGKAKTALQLTGNWTGGTYGQDLVNLYNDLTNNSEKEPAPAPSKPSVVTIDSPWGTQGVSGDTLTVKGWALSTSGIREVKVYVDGKLKTSTTDFYERKDVVQAYPGYTKTPKPGFTSKVNISDITAGGIKNFTVEVIDNNGKSTKANSSFKLNKLENLVTIDSPWGTQGVSGDTLTVKGWALSTSGIKEVKVYVDGKLKNSTTDFYERQDVVQVYPGYTKTTKPGFTSKVDISDLTTGGIKNLAVEVVASDGTVVKANSTFKLNKLENLVTIDSPWGTQGVSGDTLTVKGWALSTSGIKEVKVYVDGKLKNSTTDFYERQDVVQVYPGYTKTTKPGFTSKVDISDLTTGGIKNLAVEVVASDGTVVKANSTFKLNKLENLVTIDSPWGTQSIKSNKLTVNGWSLSSSGVKEVKVYVDGKLQKSTTSFSERKDVIQAYPMYSHIAKPGFSSVVDLSNITSNGLKKLEVEVINNDGSSKKASSSFKLDRLNTIITVDNPWFENSNSDILSVKGWAISYDEVSEVKVYIDETLRGTTKSLYARTDVNKAYPEYNNAPKPGFTVDIDMSKDLAGSKKLTIQVVLKDGTTHKYEQNFRFKTKGTIGCIDSPVENDVYNAETLSVSGWILSDVDVSKVNVYVDDVLRGTTLSKVRRDDVIKAFPGYKVGADCGYSLNIHVKDLSAGVHTLKVEGINSDGGKFEQKTTFYYKINNKLIVLDPGHNIGVDDGAYSNDRKYSERKLNDEIAVVTKAKLEDKGYKVIYTRNPFSAMFFKDVNDSLSTRANLANSLDAKLFISIHQNSFNKESAHGTEVYYTTSVQDSGFPQQDRELKVSKSKSLSENMVSKISSSTNIYNRGSKDGNLFVLRNTKMPAVLVECGFITNPGDAQKLSDSSYQNKIAQAIADSVGTNF